MSSLFQGAPNTASSYVSTTTEVPRWQQDAIYNQIQLATNAANRPYTSYQGETVAGITPQQQQAYDLVSKNVGAWQPNMNFATSGLKSFADKGTADQFRAGQAKYLPMLDTATSTTAQSLSERALAAANPYLTAAGQTSASQVGQYMSPYQQGVLDVIAKQGARNLSENLLPQVSDAFIRAGQFGSNRMGEFGSRALRDTQEAILNQQAKAAQEGYGQALSAAQGDLGRQGQLAGTAGSIAGADLSRILQGGAQYGNIAQVGLTAEQQAQAAQGQDYARQMTALENVGEMERRAGAMRAADVAALEAAGAAQRGINQQRIDADVSRFEAEKNYPQKQLDWLSTQIRGIAPLVPGVQTQTGSTTGATYSPSPLSQLATGIYTAKGLASI